MKKLFEVLAFISLLGFAFIAPVYGIVTNGYCPPFIGNVLSCCFCCAILFFVVSDMLPNKKEEI